MIIGTNSLALFEDNPVEREWIHSQFPGVTVIEVPDNQPSFAQALEDWGAFHHLTISKEDRQRLGGGGHRRAGRFGALDD